MPSSVQFANVLPVLGVAVSMAIELDAIGPPVYIISPAFWFVTMIA